MRKSQRRIVDKGLVRMYAMPEHVSGISAVRRRMYSEVLIGKALKILSLVGYFHRAALACEKTEYLNTKV